MVSSTEPLSIHAELLPAGSRTTQEKEKEANANFGPFQESYGPTMDDTNNNDQSSKANTLLEEDKDEQERVSFWGFHMFALLFKWILSLPFGVLSLLWSLVSGHFVRQLLLSSSDKSSSSQKDDDENTNIRGNHWIQDYVSAIQSLFQFHGVSSGPPVPSLSSTNMFLPPNKRIPVYHALPPALVALAILTLIALVVHPEGLTWVMLSNIRAFMISLLHSSSTCWALVVRDYGLVGTVSTASASVALVLILAVVLHNRAFLCHSSTCNSSVVGEEHPRQVAAAAAADKKRKKRKGGGGKQTGAGEPTSSSIPSFSRLAKVEEVSSENDTPFQDSRSSDPGGKQLVKVKVNESSMVNQPEENEVTWPTMDSTVSPVSQDDESPSVLESVVSIEEAETPGLATVDSASDDLSCESFSAILPPPSKKQNKNRSRKNNKAKRSGQKQTNGAPKTNTTTSTPKEVVAVSKGDHESKTKKVTPNSKQHQVDYSKKQGNEKRSFESKGRGVAKGKLNQRVHGNGKGGMDHKSPKNQAPPKHHAPPRKAKNNNNAQAITSSPRTSPASPAGSRSSTSYSNKSGRDTPESPATQNLFSCELGASGWTMPALPGSSGAEKTPSLSYVPASPYSQRSANYCYPSPNPSLAPSDTSASLDSSCRMWDSTETMVQNSVIFMPQQGRPVRAPPGFAPPAPSFPGAATTRPMVGSAALPAATCSVPFTTGVYAPLRSGNDMASFGPPSSPSFGNSGPAAFSLGGNGYEETSTPRRSLVKENPFADDKCYGNTTNGGSDDAEGRIEAELQELEELGGQMVGSVLDF